MHEAGVNSNVKKLLFAITWNLLFSLNLQLD
jgi:hypothetical protein